jgi:hypothetical protein
MGQDMGTYMLAYDDLVGYCCEVALTKLLVNIEVERCTIFSHLSSGSNLIPVDAGNLKLTNVEQQSPQPYGIIEDVTITGKATLTDCTPSETVTVKKLPIDVLIGTDKFGNTLYFLQNK